MQLDLPTSAPAHPLQGAEPLSYKGERVLTTEMAATAFEVEAGRLGNNFDRNRDRFEEGKYFHKVEGADLRDLKDRTSLRGSVGANARSLILWTERGIARHAKMLETDTAWAIYEALENTYFAVRAGSSGPSSASMPAEVSAREIRLQHRHFLSIAKMAGLDGNQRLIAANRATKRGTGFDVLGEMGITHLIAPVADPLVIPTKLGLDLGGISAMQINRMLLGLGLQVKEFDHNGRPIWRPTAKGISLGAQVVDVERDNDTGSAQHLKWPLAATLALLRDLCADDGLGDPV